MNLLEQSLGQLACDLPGSTRIFHRYKLDFCCGGQQSLREAMEAGDVEPADLLADLAEIRHDEVQEQDWRHAPMSELIEHILQRFHEAHREQLPELIRLARQVEETHGQRADHPTGLVKHLVGMYQDLLSHLQKEEQILFPLLRHDESRKAQLPMLVMRHEHDAHGQGLQKLAQLTADFSVPEDACNTWRALYAGLVRLKEDLMQHIHLENNVLFPQAEQAGGCPAWSPCQV